MSTATAALRRRGYSFSHAITQDVSESLLPIAQRRELHAAMAGLIQGQSAEVPTSSYAALAHHWSQANNVPKSLLYLCLASQEALGNYANLEAAGCSGKRSRYAARGRKDLKTKAAPGGADLLFTGRREIPLLGLGGRRSVLYRGTPSLRSAGAGGSGCSPRVLAPRAVDSDPDSKRSRSSSRCGK